MDAELTRFLHDTMPFAALIGAVGVAAAPEEVRARVGYAAQLCTSGGILHGGLLMALADTTGAWCAFLNLPADGSGTTTIESKTNFLRAVRTGHVEAVSRPLHVGRTVIVVDTELRDADDRLAARVTQTQAVLAPR
jgi:uncharacterized protein (TIGR00369 family)